MFLLKFIKTIVSQKKDYVNNWRAKFDKFTKKWYNKEVVLKKKEIDKIYDRI